MKQLSKPKFIEEFSRAIQTLGYTVVMGRTKYAVAHYFRRLSDGSILNLALESSGSRPAAYTLSFYLSISFTWSFLPEGYPSQAYDRIGSFLEPDERRLFSNDEDLLETVVDVWREGYTDADIRVVLSLVSKAEPRFLSQIGLQRSLYASMGLRIHAKALVLALRELPKEAADSKIFAEAASKSLRSVNLKPPHDNLVALTALDLERVAYHLGRDWAPPEAFL